MTLNLTGVTCNSLVVIEKAESRGGRTRWKCRCTICNLSTIAYTQDIKRSKRNCRCQKGVKKRGSVGQYGFNKLYGRYKIRARKKNISFELTKEEFKTIVDSNCFYCGLAPSQESKRYYATNPNTTINGLYIYNGVDRANSDDGYTKENSVACCVSCNVAKSGMTQTDFYKWIERLYLYLKTNGFPVTTILYGGKRDI